MNFSSFLKPNSPRPKSLRSSEAEQSKSSEPSTPERKSSTKKSTSSSGATAKSSSRPSSTKSTAKKPSSTLYATTAASRARQKAAAESLSRSGSSVGKRKDGSMGLTTSGRTLTSSATGRSLTSSGSGLDRKKREKDPVTSSSGSRVERKKKEAGATGQRLSTSTTTPDKPKKDSTFSISTDRKRKEESKDEKQAHKSKIKSSTRDEKKDEQHKDEKRKEKKKTTSSKDSEKKESSSKDAKHKSTTSRDERHHTDSTSSKDSGKDEKKKRKSRDSTSLTRRVAKILSGSKTPDLLPQSESPDLSHDGTSNEELAQPSTSYEDEDEVDDTGELPGEIKEVSKWPWNIRFVRTVSLKKRFDRSDPKRASDPPPFGSSTQIYTDWANHYLEKARYKRQITDLQNDICDGVLLADVVHAVTNQRVPSIYTKPKNATQMTENLNKCLVLLAGLGVNIDGLNSTELCEGNLKAILSLFFSLSRYKQQQKQGQGQAGQLTAGTYSSPQLSTTPVLTDVNANATGSNPDMLSRLPSPFTKTSKAQPVTPEKSTGTARIPGGGSAAVNVNRRTSAASDRSRTTAGHASQGTKTPNGRDTISPNTSLSRIRAPGSQTRIQTNQSRGTNSTGSITSHGTSPANQVARTQSVHTSSSSEVNKNNSMLDKFKFFKDKGKSTSKATSKSAGKTKDVDRGKGASNDASVVTEGVDEYGAGSTASLQRLKKGKISKKEAAALKEEQRKNGSSGSIQSRVSSTTSVSSTSSSGRRALAPQPAGRSDPSLKDGQRSATNSASRLATAGDKSSLLRAKGSVSASSFSSIPAAPGSNLPKPGSKPPKSGDKIKVKNSQSRESLAGQHGQPARRSASMSAATPQSRVPALPPGQRAPAGMPQSRPPQAHISFLAQVQRAHAQEAAQTHALTSASTPALRQAQPPPPPRDDSLRNHSQKSKPEMSDSGVSTQSSSSQSSSSDSSAKSAASASSRQQILPGSLQSASYTGMSPSKVPFPSIPEEPPPKPKKVDSDTQTNVSAVASAKQNTARQIQSNLVSASMPHLRLASAQAQLMINPSLHMRGAPRARSPKSPGTPPTGLPPSASRPPPAGAPAASLTHAQINSPSRNVPTGTPPHYPQSAFTKPPPRRSTDSSTGPGLRDNSTSSINHSDSNVSTASESNVSNSSSSKSGNNSASSTDSVIFRPSSCDELESGMESDVNVGPRSPQVKSRPTLPNSLPTTPPVQPMDHISSLRKKQQMAQQALKRDDAEEERSSYQNSAQNTPPRREAMDGIKPMQPIARSTPYNFLRNGAASPSLMRNIALQNGSYSPQSASSRLGVNRPLIDPSKLISNSMRRNVANCSADSADYTSDLDAYDVTAGYMSDGDILKSNRNEEASSGYISEGGASMYAKRLQQRFREGYIAVQACMEKSAAHMVDDDSFEDSSSISSGDISDTINDISTDEITTGSSLSGDTESAQHHAYNSLKGRPPLQGQVDHLSRSLPNRSGSFQAGGMNWKKYAIGDSGPGAKPYQSALAARKSSHAAGDLRSRSGTAIAIEDPNFLDGQTNGHASNGGKVDSETNTDQSILMMRKQQGYWPAGQPLPGQYGMRRPSAPLTGERLSNYRTMIYPRPQAGNMNMKLGSGGAVYMVRKDGGVSDMGPEAYSANTLERKRRAQMNASASSQNGGQDYASNSLGRRRPAENIKEKLFGSRTSLNKTQTSENANMASTIISNPHATYGRLTDASPTGSTASTPGGRYYVNMYMTNSADGIPSRPLSAMSSPVGGQSWIRSGHGMVANGMRSAMSETESMECLQNSIQSQIQQAKALAQASRNILAQNQHYTQSLQRSDSFKSTRSERAYANTNQAHTLPRTGSCTQLSPATDGPASPAPSHGSVQSTSAFNYPTHSSVNSSAGYNTTSPYTTLTVQSKLSNSKDNDLHGSALSLLSSSSSVYSTAEDKYHHEIRKLRRDLESAQDKVHTLTTQLSTNAHVVSAFEQSLTNMTSRLQQLTSSAERKDNEVSELRATIDALRHQTGISYNPDSTHSAVRRQSSNISKDGHSPEGAPGIRRQMSAESMSSINSMSSACSATSQQSSLTDTDKRGHKKKGSNWLRSSFNKAFSRTGNKKSRTGSVSDVDGDALSMRSDASAMSHTISMPSTPVKGSTSTGHLYKDEGADCTVLQLQQRLHEKDMKLTDTQLEALSSAAQLDQLRDNMNRMKLEMSSLKADNSRLQFIVAEKGLGSSSMPVTPTTDPPEKRLSLGDPSKLDEIMLTSGGPASPDRSGQSITISVFLSALCDVTAITRNPPEQVLIGNLAVSGRTKWDMLDAIVRRTFKEYCLRVDPVTNLGLASDSVLCYHIGNQITRSKESRMPELLPCGYLVGDTTNITIGLKGTPQNSVDALAFETLIPKSIVQRYISLLLEHRRIILCGPTGTGKSYLAHKIAEYLVVKSGKDLGAGAIATFNVDHKSSKELRQYLANIAEQCEHSASDLPNVIILDNLHHIGSLGEVFNGFLRVKYQQCPYIIGTMNQATCSTTNLQLHHNFRWVLCANHMEPVKGFLGRYLRRKLVEEEVKSGTNNNELSKIIEWIPKVWQHLNKFLETHSSSEVTVGPRLFLSCPMDVCGAQVWFTDLWNYSIVPYLLEAVREGIQTYGHRAPWEDPSDWITETYPFGKTSDPDWPNLLKMRPEDVGYDTAAQAQGGAKPVNHAGAQSDAEADPLLNMLMRLQEAASYSSPQSGESDSASMDNQSIDSRSGVNMESTL